MVHAPSDFAAPRLVPYQALELPIRQGEGVTCPQPVGLFPSGFPITMSEDATGQALAYVYARETWLTPTSRMLTMDEAQRIASNIAKLPKPAAEEP